MKATISRYWHLGMLALILFLALAVRSIGINYGLPYVYYPDEAVLVNHAMAFGTGDLNPHYFIYPSLYMYVLFFIYGLSFAIGWVAGVFASTDDFVKLFFTDATLFYLPGRLIAMLSGVMSVGMVYLLGRRAYNVQVGLIASSILAFSVSHVTFSHYVKTHVPAGLLVIVALGLASSIYAGRDSWWHYLLAGVIAGLAASTVYHAGFVIVSVAVAHVLRWRDSSRNTSRVHLFSTRFLGAGVACFAAFIIGSPYALLDWPTFVTELGSTAATFYSGGFWERGTLYPFTSLLEGMGTPLGLLALLGLGYGLVRRRSMDLILLSQPLFLAGFLMLFATKEPHHMLIAFPALSILSASLLVDVVKSSIPRRAVLQPVALVLLTVLLLFTPAKSSFQNSLRMALPDTRSIAKGWVEENIPSGSRIVMDSGKYYLGAFGPPLRLSRWTLEQFAARAKPPDGHSLARRDGTRRVGYAGEAEYFKQELRTMDDQPGYDIVQILHDAGSQRADVLSLDEYLSKGVRYAIVSSQVREQYAPGGETSVRYPHKAAQYRNFYDSLETRAALLRVFSPSVNMGGPILWIYELSVP